MSGNVKKCQNSNADGMTKCCWCGEELIWQGDSPRDEMFGETGDEELDGSKVSVLRCADCDATVVYTEDFALARKKEDETDEKDTSEDDICRNPAKNELK